MRAKASLVFQRGVWVFIDPLWLTKTTAQESHFELMIGKKKKKEEGIIPVGDRKAKVPLSSKVQREIKISVSDEVITYLQS